MSKSAFYQTKESLRKTREQEYRELLLARDVLEEVSRFKDNLKYDPENEWYYISNIFEAYKKYEEYIADVA